MAWYPYLEAIPLTLHYLLILKKWCNRFSSAEHLFNYFYFVLQHTSGDKLVCQSIYSYLKTIYSEYSTQRKEWRIRLAKRSSSSNLHIYRQYHLSVLLQTEWHCLYINRLALTLVIVTTKI